MFCRFINIFNLVYFFLLECKLKEQRNWWYSNIVKLLHSLYSGCTKDLKSFIQIKKKKNKKLWNQFFSQRFEVNSFDDDIISLISVLLISQFSSVNQSYLTLCNPMDCSTPGLPVHHQLPEFTQTHVHSVSDAIQPSHPLSSPSPPTFNLSQHQGLFRWVSSSHQMAKVLEFQLHHQSFQWIFRTDFL